VNLSVKVPTYAFLSIVHFPILSCNGVMSWIIYSYVIYFKFLMTLNETISQIIFHQH